MTLPRGFKSYCERAVTSLRAELELQDEHPLDMDVLARHLEIPVYSLGAFLKLAGRDRSEQGLQALYQCFSAVTYFDGPRRTIVCNEEHTHARHRSNLAHELAHALLHHPPQIGLDPVDDQQHEEQATWFGGVLMLTATQAVRIVRDRMNLTHATERYQLSGEMLRFRLNVTGAARRAV